MKMMTQNLLLTSELAISGLLLKVLTISMIQILISLTLKLLRWMRMIRMDCQQWNGLLVVVEVGVTSSQPCRLMKRQ